MKVKTPEMNPSVFLSPIPEPDLSLTDEKLAAKWDRLFDERSEVLKALEKARTEGIIGHSLDAKVVFGRSDHQFSAKLSEYLANDRQRMQDLLIVSQADNVSEAAVPTAGSTASYDAPLLNCTVMVSKADGAKCERCWKYDVRVGADQNHPTVCPRCASVLNAGAGA